MKDANPYTPPGKSSASGAALPRLPKDRWGELEVRVESVYRGWWTRRLWLAGSIAAELYYNPGGNGERLYVDGNLLVTTPFLQFSGNVDPHLDFLPQHG